MKSTKPLGFLFKSEPIWMLVFAFGRGVLGLLIVLFLSLIVKFAN